MKALIAAVEFTIGLMTAGGSIADAELSVVEMRIVTECREALDNYHEGRVRPESSIGGYTFDVEDRRGWLEVDRIEIDGDDKLSDYRVAFVFTTKNVKDARRCRIELADYELDDAQIEELEVHAKESRYDSEEGS